MLRTPTLLRQTPRLFRSARLPTPPTTILCSLRYRNVRTAPLSAAKSTQPGLRDLSKRLHEALVGCNLKDDDCVQTVVDRVLQQSVPKSHITVKDYDDVIDFLFANNLIVPATRVFSRMENDGIAPSTKAKAKLEALKLLRGSIPEAASLRALKTLFSEDDFYETDAVAVLDLMSQLGAKPMQLRTVAEMFVEAQGAGYFPDSSFAPYFLQTGTAEGELDQALDAIAEEFSPMEKAEFKRQTTHDPISVALNALGHLDSNSLPPSDRILSVMAEHGANPDVTALNEHLARQVILGLSANAISTYNAMRALTQSHKPATPNSFTFGAMFVLYLQAKLHLRGTRHHQTEQSLSTLHPRTLFRHLTDFSHTVVSRSPLNTPLLNVATRTFMALDDYAATYVALTTLARNGVLLDHKTYYSIIQPIVHRVWSDIQANKKDSWTEAFLGAPIRDIALEETTIDDIFYLVSRPTFNLSAPLYRPKLKHREDPSAFKMPTMEMLESVPRPRPLNFHYALEPLNRIVKRAIFAQIAAGTPDPENTVEHVIQEAATEMTGSQLTKAPERVGKGQKANKRK